MPDLELVVADRQWAGEVESEHGMRNALDFGLFADGQVGQGDGPFVNAAALDFQPALERAARGLAGRQPQRHIAGPTVPGERNRLHDALPHFLVALAKRIDRVLLAPHRGAENLQHGQQGLGRGFDTLAGFAVVPRLDSIPVGQLLQFLRCRHRLSSP